MIAHSRFHRLEVFQALNGIVPSLIGRAADDDDALATQLINERRRQILRPRRAETIDDAVLIIG